MIRIDGAKGEGGGQVLRTALALSLVTAQPFVIDGIRKGRSKPGLLRQHLTAVHAAATLGAAELSGDALGSLALGFRPRALRSGTFAFAVGTAGSATLVLQTVLPALLAAREPSRATFEGGTHNPAAPPFEAIEGAFLPLCRRIGARVDATIARRGFYPKGGGRIALAVEPSPLGRLELGARGALLGREVRALVSGVPASVGAREIDAFVRELGWGGEDVHAETNDAPASPGPGNALVAVLRHEHVTEVFTAFGERGRSAEAVAQALAAEVRAYLARPAPVGEHLADQLILPLVLGEGGSFRTTEPSGHLRTQVDTVAAFVGERIVIDALGGGVHEVRVRGLRA